MSCPIYKPPLSLLDTYLRRRAEVAKNKLWPDIEICTVDSYRGNEREIIPLDLVVAGNGDTTAVGFIRDNGRLNMALSRAQNGLLVLGRASGIYRGVGTAPLQMRRRDEPLPCGGFGITESVPLLLRRISQLSSASVVESGRRRKS
ncbi:MAG: hypothetical protein M1829_002742 [Trizodia sp. TS-e1964]|nr:MAG: hypothetical protein M1829_002742 [Trizodia sp. TS-e1964]